MKIFAVSNIRGGVEKIVDAFDDTGVNIVAKEMKPSMDNLEEMVAEPLDNESYDFVVLMVNDYIGASIRLNKYDDIKAAVCDDDEDFELARENKANVFIIRDSKNSLDLLVKEISEVSKPAQKAATLFKGKKEIKKEETEEEEQEEEEISEKGIKRKGLVGRIKSHLGIVENE